MKRDYNLKVTWKSPAEMMVAVQYVDFWLTIKVVKHAKMMVSYWLFYFECREGIFQFKFKGRTDSVYKRQRIFDGRY